MQTPKIWFFVFMAAYLFSFAARAQEPAPLQCWEITNPATNVEPYAPILLNKCTGKAWLLSRSDTQEATSSSRGTFAYRWRPITTDDTAEASFPTLRR
jgi:hypothetical protein